MPIGPSATDAPAEESGKPCGAECKGTWPAAVNPPMGGGTAASVSCSDQVTRRLLRIRPLRMLESAPPVGVVREMKSKILPSFMP